MLKFDEVTKNSKMVIIQLKQLNRHLYLLKKVNLAIVGPSGSGKSTFLTMVVRYKHQHPVKYILMMRKSQK